MMDCPVHDVLEGLIHSTLHNVIHIVLHNVMYNKVYCKVYCVLESSLNTAHYYNGGHLGVEGQGMSQTKLSVWVTESVRYSLGSGLVSFLLLYNI